MQKALLIVESPAKARTIEKFLGRDFKVKATVGHIKDLPEDRLGVDIENGFKPQYQIIRGKRNIVKEVKKAAGEVNSVYLAPDPDREGEAIAWHIADELRDKDVYRVLFHELTEKAIQEAIRSPGRLDPQKFESQQARRILDRLVGYQISPILWDKVRRGLSAGRVQSVAVRIICDRERVIQRFSSQEYWTVTARLEGKNAPPMDAKLQKIDNKKIEIKDENQCKDIVAALKTKVFRVVDIKKRTVRRNPKPPFITSTMQQEANQKLRFTAKKTMSIAQRLYEGVDLGDKGPTGLITYMRTDSVRVAESALDGVRDFIKKQFGSDYLPAKPNVYKNKKGIQDAHEAIRPTSVGYTPEEVTGYLTSDELALYTLVWKRFVASQMKTQIVDQTSVDIEAGRYLFRATGSKVKFPGYTMLYGEDKGQGGGEGELPDLTKDEILKLRRITPKQHFTEPPPRFTEATLVKELEENGIGRPSTYAMVISTIQDRNYVRKTKGRFCPTELGFLVTDLLTKSFPELMDVNFTAQMEDKLDKIEEGTLKWVDILRDFYGPFSEDLKQAKVAMESVKSHGIRTDISCSECGKPMVIRWGRTGEFLACSAFPGCSHTESFVRDERGSIQIVKGVLNRTGVKCPQEGCGGDIVQRRSRRGKMFYGCSNYPKCTFVSWYRPVLQSCPRCGNPFLVEKYSRREGQFLACPNKECAYKE